MKTGWVKLNISKIFCAREEKTSGEEIFAIDWELFYSNCNWGTLLQAIFNTRKDPWWMFYFGYPIIRF